MCRHAYVCVHTCTCVYVYVCLQKKKWPLFRTSREGTLSRVIKTIKAGVGFPSFGMLIPKKVNWLARYPQVLTWSRNVRIQPLEFSWKKTIPFTLGQAPQPSRGGTESDSCGAGGALSSVPAPQPVPQVKVVELPSALAHGPSPPPTPLDHSISNPQICWAPTVCQAPAHRGRQRGPHCLPRMKG